MDSSKGETDNTAAKAYYYLLFVEDKKLRRLVLLVCLCLFSENAIFSIRQMTTMSSEIIHDNGNNRFPCRVILLLDLDCFYAQCERVRLGLDAETCALALLQV